MPEVQGLEPNPPAPAEWVELRAPGIDKPYRCAPSAVDHWKARGWEVVGGAEPPANAARVVVEEAAPLADQAAGSESVQVVPVPEGDAPSPARRR